MKGSRKENKFGIIFLVAAALFVSSISGAVATTVSIGSNSIEQGGTAVVPLMITDVTGVAGAEINITFNPDVVEIVNTTGGDFDIKPTNPPTMKGPNYVLIQVGQYDAGLDGIIKVADLKFRAVGTAGLVSDLNIASAILRDIDGNNIPVDEINNGIISIADLNPPASISGLSNNTGNFWINWNWNNPTEPNFDHTMIFIDGSFVENRSVNYYNLTALSAHAVRTIGTRTVSKSGIANPTLVTQTTQIPNNVPIMTPIRDIIIDENQSLIIQLSSTDADGDVPLYSINRTDIPNDFDFNAGAALLSPSYDQAGVYSVNFGVSDGYGGIDNKTAKITVNNVNRPPSITSVSADKTIVNETELFTVTVVASDPDGDALTYQFDWQNDGTWSVNQSANIASHSYVVAGTYTVNARVWDINSASATDSSLIITVEETPFVNDLPSITSVSADKTTVDENEEFTVTVVASDPDNDTLTYQFDWQNDGTWSVNQSANTASHSYAVAGTYTVNVRVWDINSASATDSSLVITVEQATQPTQPVVTNPSANPNEILLEEANNSDYQNMPTRLEVTVTDAIIDTVTIDLSSIGGSAAAMMTSEGGNVYSITTNATGTPGSKSLAVNATDISGNSNVSVNIPLSVLRNGDVDGDGNVTFLKDALYLVRNTRKVPGYESLNPLVADVNGDGVVTFMGDALYLIRHTQGVPGYGLLR